MYTLNHPDGDAIGWLDESINAQRVGIKFILQSSKPPSSCQQFVKTQTKWG